jgi:hypothetical protein
MAKIPRPYEVEQQKVILQSEVRALHTKRDDIVSNKNVGLYDQDEIIKYYFDNVIMPRVEEQGKTINVPVFYSSPEKWKSIQKDGFIRDARNKIMVPLITYKRASTDKNRELSRNIFPDNPQLFQTYTVNYTEGNKYDLFSKLTNTIPQKELYNIIIPDFVILSFDAIIWTDHISQMNKLVEAISYAEGTYWGNDRFKFFTSIDSFSHSYEIVVGEDRAIQSTFSIIMQGYVIPDSIQKQIAQKSEKSFTIKQLALEFNMVNVKETLTSGGSKFDYKLTLCSELISGKAYNYSSEALIYLAADLTKTATYVDTDTAKFYGDFLAIAPTPLPNTSINDFDFYINGQHIAGNMSGLSFSEQSDGLVLTIDPNTLGFSIHPGDEVIAKGKFKT